VPYPRETTIPAILPSNTPTAPALPNATTILPQLIIFLPPGAAPFEEKAAPAPLHGEEGVNSCCHWTFQSLSSFSHTPPPPAPPQSRCREGRTRLAEGTKETGENRAEEKNSREEEEQPRQRHRQTGHQHCCTFCKQLIN